MGTELRLSDHGRDSAFTRLRRIEGQIRGLQRMLREERDCAEILQQLSAARAALDRVAIGLLTAGMEQCLESTRRRTPQARGSLRKLQHSLLMLR